MQHRRADRRIFREQVRPGRFVVQPEHLVRARLLGIGDEAGTPLEPPADLAEVGIIGGRV
jgi:hypothetical protein